ncbi:K(+)-transporting ATPase subunit C [Nocardiopsis sp. RSe5-2]|uniref:Potassium-transporting ATPase KdpC subunit n=1 Tax=Nocardiopsis endophytica TaxID=3018445 RepID=A0ABT4UAL7_9ACTN|nr:K(+)-transporting ATPase subunit C [Nocardiopsis endophytica]MDA2813975.1 K(+)-transporting ATPase subunit C [Nocardiopsis endophytica]
MLRQLTAAAGMLLVFTALTGLVYPLVVTGAAQAAFGHRADGSLIERDGEAVGSELIGQPFEGEGYFHPRPSAVGYDGAASGGDNLGPSDEGLLEGIEARTEEYRAENGLADDAEVPVDAVTASASGLDPHITVANARLQTSRVAEARGMDTGEVARLVDDNTTGRTLGVLGEKGVNVLELNLALDEEAPAS